MFPPPSVHTKVAFATFELASKSTTLFTHVISAFSASTFAIATVGIAISLATVTGSVLVHPFNGSLTTRVYKPIISTTGSSSSGSRIVEPPGPVHENSAFKVVEFPSNVMVGLAQVIKSDAGSVTEISGTSIFGVTVTLSTLTHP